MSLQRKPEQKPKQKARTAFYPRKVKKQMHPWRAKPQRKRKAPKVRHHSRLRRKPPELQSQRLPNPRKVKSLRQKQRPHPRSSHRRHSKSRRQHSRQPRLIRNGRNHRFQHLLRSKGERRIFDIFPLCVTAKTRQRVCPSVLTDRGIFLCPKSRKDGFSAYKNKV